LGTVPKNDFVESLIKDLRPWGEEREKFLHPAQILGHDTQESTTGQVSLEHAPDEVLFWPQSELRPLGNAGHAETLETLDVIGTYQIRSIQRVPNSLHYKLVLKV
jgi:hypothetical protein